MAGGHLRITGLSKSFDEHVAVDNIDIDIAAGEFFSLLGPSGCGKTTTLRMIAGFERPTSGRIEIDGDDMAHTPPHLRPVNTVFQSYALFPHLSVIENVAFGLRYQKVPAAEAAKRADAALDLVQMSEYRTRRPVQLSGGQQQRVALARALILEPRVLLLDEPLGALDAKLRKALQIELKTLQEQVGITFVYVTHDQEEALTMSDRLAVMRDGHVEQIGPPDQVYERPASTFVADFLGVCNLMPVIVESHNGVSTRVKLGDQSLVSTSGRELPPGPAYVSIRPERIRLCTTTDGCENLVQGTIDRIVYAGPQVQLMVGLPNGSQVQAVIPNGGGPIGFGTGDAVGVDLPADALLLLADEAQATPA